MKRIDNTNKLSPKQFTKEASKNDTKVGEKGSASQRAWKTPSGRRKKKETELEFTRRLLAENPRGLKGLAYVLI